jgi:CBS domain containing-hemolysin-like protein
VTNRSTNSITNTNRKKVLSDKKAIRLRAVEAVLRLLGGKNKFQADDLAIIANINKKAEIFNSIERRMIEGVLNLAEFSVQSIMTSCKKLHTIDTNSNEEIIRKQIYNSPFSKLIIINKLSNEFLGFIQKQDVFKLLISGKKLSWTSILQKPLIINEDHNILDLLEDFKKTDIQLAFIFDENKKFIGIVTLLDIIKIFIKDIK